MNFKYMILNDRSQTKKAVYYLMYYMTFQKGKITGTEMRLLVTRALMGAGGVTDYGGTERVFLRGRNVLYLNWGGS